jgi:hypothetical protein
MKLDIGGVAKREAEEVRRCLKFETRSSGWKGGIV